ncbi:MAG: ribosome biogenesis GTPase YlqF [Eubacteriaceae bacterium]|jgi:ribosome biogenesis GTPase A|nr:ribosome biogenesis GTPase YlqF [Eubacteriaceae bacterium]
MNQTSSIQWYPGHMAKAFKKIKEQLKLIDIVIEIVDARIPISSKNPSIESLIGNKKHILLLNKADLADEGETNQWIDKIKREDKHTYPMAFSIHNPRDKKKLLSQIRQLKTKSNQKRCLICGIPNVGKSSVINLLSGKKKTVIGNKPGVTKVNQWVKIDEKILLLDTPGLLWPKFEDPKVGMRLAWIGSIKDTIYEKENLAFELLLFLHKNYSQRLIEAYQLDPKILNEKTIMLMEAIASIRRFLIRGGDYDYARTADTILKDFKDGKLGPITIEKVKGSTEPCML